MNKKYTIQTDLKDNPTTKTTKNDKNTHTNNKRLNENENLKKLNKQLQQFY